MCDKVDVILIFLSSYSYDYNFIEIFFAILKRWIKRHDYLAINYETFDNFLKQTIKTQNNRHNSKALFKTIYIKYSYYDN